MSDKYDYEIETEKLNPPIGGTLHYAAKLAFMVKLKQGVGSERVYPGLGEVWGKTEKEAEDKIRKAAEDWISAHS